MQQSSPEIGPHKYGQLFFDKGAKAIQRRKLVFLTNGVATTGHP